MVNMSEAAKTIPEADDGEPVTKKQRVEKSEDAPPPAPVPGPSSNGDEEEEEDEEEGEQVSSYVEELPKEISDALDDLDTCQRDIDALNEKASEEILKVEQSFNRRRKPMYAKRTDIIAKIPQFWLTAFSNHPQMATMIDEEEEKFLQYLRDMIVDENDDIKSGYKIKFIFEDNPYFENKELVKDVRLPYGSPDERPVVVSTPIKWKKGMDLLKVKEKKPKKKARMFNDTPQSFLEWLTQSGDPTGDEVAEILKDDMWPNPMQYYLAPDVDCDENGMDEDEDDEDEFEGEDDENDGDNNVVVVEEEGEEEDEEEGAMGEEDDDGEEEGVAGGPVAHDNDAEEEAEEEEEEP
jgi:template-activating factor I